MRLKCLVSIQESVQQGGGQSSVQRLTDQQTPLQFPPYTIRKHRAGDIYGYLWQMRKTSQGLQFLAFCSDRPRLVAELCTDGWTSKELNCHKSSCCRARFSLIARTALSPSGSFATQCFLFTIVSSISVSMPALAITAFDINKFTYLELSTLISI